MKNMPQKPNSIVHVEFHSNAPEKTKSFLKDVPLGRSGQGTGGAAFHPTGGQQKPGPSRSPGIRGRGRPCPAVGPETPEDGAVPPGGPPSARLSAPAG